MARDRQPLFTEISTLNQDGILWLAAVNLIIWTGLFLYLLSLEKKISRKEDDGQ